MTTTISPSPTTRLTGAAGRPVATLALACAVIALTFAFAASPQASAQTRKTGCVTHAKQGHHTCSASKNRKHDGKSGSKSKAHHAKHAVKHRASAPGATGEASAASCSDGTNAILDGEGSFTCANGSEAGCEEGFTPVASSDGSTLLCEPEANEGEEANEGGEAEG
jgi:hypothetical protein